MGISHDERESASVVLQAGEDVGGDQSQQWAEFDAFRDQGDASTAGMSVWVYRIPTNAAGEPDGGDSRQLFTSPIDRYTLQQIFERVKKGFMPRGYGTATIRIMVRRDKVRGVIWQKLFIIEKSSLDDEPEMGAKVADTSGVAALAEAMRQQNQLIIQLISRQQNAPVSQSPPIDPIESAMKMVTAMTGMMGVLANRTAPAGPAASGVGDMIAGIREMMKLTREIGGMAGESADDGADPDGAVGVLKAIAPIADLVKTLIVSGRATPAVPQLSGPVQAEPAALPAQPARAAQPAPARPTQPARPTVIHPERMPVDTAVASPPPPTETAQFQGDNAMFGKVTEILGDLVKLAENGSDATALGATVVDLIPEAYEQHFLTILESDNWFAKLAAFNPAVNSQPEWFAALRYSILAEYTDDADSTPPAS